MEASDIKRFKELEDESRRLKQMYAELCLDHRILKDIVEKSFDDRRMARTGGVCSAKA
jgi:putative transposase